MEDVDVSLMIKRSDFEEIAAPLFGRIKEPLEAAIAASGVDVKDLAAVEQIGGAVRIPMVQAMIKEAFGQEPGRRLNSEECVAKVFILLLLFYFYFYFYFHFHFHFHFWTMMALKKFEILLHA